MSDYILVTGSSGFLGKHVVDYLKTLRYKIIGVSFNNRNANCDVNLQVDLRNSNQCDAILTPQLFDKAPKYVFHLAGYNGGIQYNIKYPGQIFSKNTNMGINLINSIVNSKINSKIVMVTSSCAYPDIDTETLEEKDFFAGQPNYTVSCHAYAKRNLQLLCDFYNKEFGLDAVSTCITTMYGEGDTVDLARTKVVEAIIVKMINAIRNNQDIKLFGTGSPLREITYVKDIPKILMAVADKYDDHEEVINIGSGQEYSILDLANMIAKILDYKGEIQWDKSYPDGQYRKFLSKEKQSKILGQIDFTPIEVGLKETIEWTKTVI